MQHRGPQRLTIFLVIVSFVYGNYFIVRMWRGFTDLAKQQIEGLYKCQKQLICDSVQLIKIQKL